MKTANHKKSKSHFWYGKSGGTPHVLHTKDSQANVYRDTTYSTPFRHIF